MSSRELIELRRALERLRDALMAAIRVLDDAHTPQTEDDDAYVELGAPFGANPRARRLWGTFRQYTTRN